MTVHLRMLTPFFIPSSNNKFALIVDSWHQRKRCRTLLKS